MDGSIVKVLVTGHQGYLGTVMTPMLAEAGHEITGVDSGLFAECILGPRPVDPPGFQLDLRDLTVEQLSGFDAVIHLAALSNDPLGNLEPNLTVEINYTASVRLAAMAREAGVSRFLYASTCSVYGVAGDHEVDEQAPLRPLTPYAESKVRVEADVAEMGDEDFSPVFLRNATAFGFSPRLRADIVLNNLVGHAVVSGKVLVLSDGTPWRPLVHVSDIARAFLAVLESPREATHCRAINVGSRANNVTVAEIAHTVVEAVDGSTLNITGEKGGDERSYRVDFSLMERLIPEFRPSWTVAEGARELATCYQRYGFDNESFTQKFTRLATIRRRLKDGSIAPNLRPTPFVEHVGDGKSKGLKAISDPEVPDELHPRAGI
jgi:nucleoside-diphosphate-sugar epimerase